MPRRILAGLFFFPLLVISAQTNGEKGDLYSLRAAGDILAGRLEKALDGYGKAADLLEGDRQDRARLRILQIRLELGQYEGLARECRALLDRSPASDVAGKALIVQILCLLEMKRDDRALALMERENSRLTGDPSTALMLSDAYRKAGLEEDAKRVDWIIKRDFPFSPENLILNGGGDRKATPRSLLP
jgi:tetratricopeptide (TPR) repeat protein